MEAANGGGHHRQFTIPWLMRAVHGASKVRLIGLLREPGERMWSAYWFWPQYRRRYGKQGKEPSGFLAYLQHVIPAFNACLKAAEQGEFGAEGGGGAHVGGLSGGGRGTGGSASEQVLWQAGSAVERATRWQLEQCAINFESLSSDNEGGMLSGSGTCRTQTLEPL